MNTVQTICGGIPRDKVRTVPTVRDGIKIDRYPGDGITREEHVGRILGGMPDIESRFIRYEPGNGTRFDLLIIPLSGFHPNDSGFVVVLDNFGKSLRAALGGAEHWTYLREKLGIALPDCIALAELFEYLTTQENKFCGLDSLIDKEGTEGE